MLLFLRPEWAAFGAGAEALIEVDGAAADRNARRRQLAGVLVDNNRLLVRSERDLHGFEHLALVRLGQVERVISDDRVNQRARGIARFDRFGR